MGERRPAASPRGARTNHAIADQAPHRSSTSRATATPTPTRSPPPWATRSSRRASIRRHHYVAVRLGDLNAQTRWVLERSGAPEPEFLPARDAARRGRDARASSRPPAHDEPIRDVGLTMAREDLDLVPILDDDGVAGRRGVRARPGAPLRARVARGLQARRADHRPRDRRRARTASSWSAATTSSPAACGCWRWTSRRCRSTSAPATWWWSATGPTCSGSRSRSGVSLLVTSNRAKPADELLELARERGAAVIVSPLDSYVTARLITLSAPCRAWADREPLTVRPDDLMADVAEQVKDIHYRAAVAVDARAPAGRARDARRPAQPAPAAGPPRRPRRAGPERSRGRPGRDRRDPRPPQRGLDRDARARARDLRPRRLDRDAGHRALPPERAGARAARPGILLLAAILSDTVILSSPTTTERDEKLRRLPRARARRWTRASSGARCSRPHLTSRASPAERIVTGDAKQYEVGGRTHRDRAGRDGGAVRCSSARTSCSRRSRRAGAKAATTSTR